MHDVWAEQLIGLVEIYNQEWYLRIKHTKTIESILVKKKLFFDYIDGTTAEYYVVCFQYFADWSAWKHKKDQEKDRVWEEGFWWIPTS
jgi:hypothetical protein